MMKVVSPAFEIYETAIVKFGKDNVAPPMCAFCQKSTGYMRFDTNENSVKNSLKFIVGMAPIPYFSLDNFTYFPLNRCASCGGYKDGFMLAARQDKFHERKLKLARKNMTLEEYSDYSLNYNRGKERGLEFLYPKKQETNFSSDFSKVKF